MRCKLIHVGLIIPFSYLFLREKGKHEYAWFEVLANGEEMETEVKAPHIEEAIRLANRHFKEKSFRTLHCGFRYTLPERDEHGINALFHQMGASFESMTGVYFEEELGYNCIVQNASKEALDLWRKLKALGKI